MKKIKYTTNIDYTEGNITKRKSFQFESEEGIIESISDINTQKEKILFLTKKQNKDKFLNYDKLWVYDFKKVIPIKKTPQIKTTKSNYTNQSFQKRKSKFSLTLIFVKFYTGIYVLLRKLLK
jgi:hypothetical protein